MNDTDKTTVETARGLVLQTRPGPWDTQPVGGGAILFDGNGNHIASTTSRALSADAAFIAASRALVPQLCDIAEDHARLLEQQAARIAELEAKLELAGKVCDILAKEAP